MRLAWTEEQQLLGDTLRRYLAKDYPFDARQRVLASPEGWSREAWATYAEMGLLGLPFAEAHGGYGGTAVDLVPVAEAFGDALVLEPYLAAVVLGGQLVARGGTAAQAAAVLPALVAGRQLLAFAHTERDARYDLDHVATRARRAGGAWTLDGEKALVLHGGAADTLVVSARTAGAVADAAGITLFLVPRGTAGVHVAPHRTIDGLRAATVTLTGVTVGDEARLGPEGGAAALIEEVADRATAWVCAEATGLMKSINDQTLAYLKSRRQFGVPIGAFQALQHRMVDMVTDWEQARSLTILAAVRVESPDPVERRRAVSAAKVKIGDAGRHVGQEAIQLHGGMGIADETKVSHSFKRLTMILRTFGDADHHLARFAAAG